MSQPKLVDQVRSVIRLKHYSARTEEADWHWIKKFSSLPLDHCPFYAESRYSDISEIST